MSKVIASCAYRQLNQLRPQIPTSIGGRAFSISSVRRFDEFVKRKSEYRMPGVNDRQLREKHGLVVPIYILSALVCGGIYAFFISDRETG